VIRRDGWETDAGGVVLDDHGDARDDGVVLIGDRAGERVAPPVCATAGAAARQSNTSAMSSLGRPRLIRSCL